jgi:hypothetical protein
VGLIEQAPVDALDLVKEFLLAHSDDAHRFANRCFCFVSDINDRTGHSIKVSGSLFRIERARVSPFVTSRSVVMVLEEYRNANMWRVYVLNRWPAVLPA